jgi:hypothetical protein
MKIAVYAIAKNERRFAERFCASARDADLVLVADTGSTDGTQEALRDAGARVVDICITPWRFDDARNAALALLPRDVDVCIALDLDEVLQSGWREEIERVWTDGATRLRCRYDWGSGFGFYWQKIHARHGYRWRHPCHEALVHDRIEERWAHTDQLLVVHMPDPNKSRGDYLDLLALTVAEDPDHSQSTFFHARELWFHRRWAEAIAEAHRYLALPTATWAEERCYAMRVIARCHAELGQDEQALAWARRATAEAPHTREPWCELAQQTYRTKRWAECYGAACSALRVTDRQAVYTTDPVAWGAQPHDLAAIAAWNLGLKSEALAHGLDALALAPDDARLRCNVESMRPRTIEPETPPASL